MDDVDELKQIHDSEISVIVLDESGSMKGNDWENAVIGAKLYIHHLKENH